MQLVGGPQLLGTLRDLLLQPLRPSRVVQRHRRLARQHGEKIAIGVVKTAERAVDVGVEVAQQLFAAARSAVR